MDLLQERYTGICLPPHLTHSPPHSLLPLQTVLVSRSGRRPQGQNPDKANEDPKGWSLMVQILHTRVGSACHLVSRGPEHSQQMNNHRLLYPLVLKKKAFCKAK